MKKVIFFSDIHLGLVTNDINRTEEIVKVSLDVVRHAIKLKKAGDDVTIVIGGDIFDHNNPSEYLIGQFIRILNLAVKYKIQTYVLYGNHDAVSDTKRKGCLDFIKKLKGDYSLVTLIDDITCIKWFTADYGYVFLTFLPHISKARLKDTKFKTVQDYIDARAKKIWEKVGQGCHQLVFSHLNVKGIIPGSEENLLKKSEIYLPDSFIEGNQEIGHIAPMIIQGHIHCFDEQTEVLTNNGWKFFSNLKKLDKVATLNPTSLELEFQKPKKIILSDYKGEMVQIKNSKIDLLVTPNHRMFGNYIRKNEDIFFEAGNPVKDFIRYYKAGKWGGEDIDVSNSLLQLIIQIVSDGSFEDKFIRFHLKKKRKVARLIELVKGLGIDYGYWVMSDGTIKINFRKESIKDFKWFFPDNTKQLTGNFRNLSVNQINIILDEYAITDGCYQQGDKNLIQISTSKKEEADLIQELCCISGIQCNLTPKKNLQGNQKQNYILSVNRKTNTCMAVPSRHYKTVKYKGKIGCVEVKNSTILVRRNGKTCVTGNSRQRLDNVNVIGSQIYVDFGEKEKKKYFAVIELPDQLGTQWKVRYKKTDCLPFVELNFDYTNGNDPSKKLKTKKMMKQAKGAVVKVNVIYDENSPSVDWEQMRKELSKSAHYVKPIIPKFVRARTVRNEKQSVNLSPVDAVKLWLASNKPKGWKRKFKLAEKYIEGLS